jgi:Fe-Mn family superoxide dismutase
VGTPISGQHRHQVRVGLFSCKDQKIFNNAAQHWNHTFYWHSISPNKTEPTGQLKELIEGKWGSVDNFVKDFSAQALANFGSGWTWLAKQGGEIAIFNTSNAGNPLTNGYQPLLTVDVWEHAYYVDYRNARATYLQNFSGLINWDFVGKNWSSDKIELKF